MDVQRAVRKPSCSACAILLISGIETCPRRRKGCERWRRVVGWQPRWGGQVPGTWARIRLIKVRIRAASWKWNYRGVVGDDRGDGGGGGDSTPSTFLRDREGRTELPGSFCRSPRPTTSSSYGRGESKSADRAAIPERERDSWVQVGAGGCRWVPRGVTACDFERVEARAGKGVIYLRCSIAEKSFGKDSSRENLKSLESG